MALENVSNLIIAYNEFYKTSDSISIENSENIVLTSNQFSDVYSDSIDTTNSHSITVKDNIFNDFQRGVQFIGCDFSTISNNTFLSLNSSAVSCYYAVVIGGCEEILILNNTISQTLVGIWIDFSTNCSIVSNRVQNSSEFCVQLENESYNCTLYHNSFMAPEGFSPYLSQAFDDGIDNLWFIQNLNSGNFWSDLGTAANYTINGDAESFDLYPLSAPLNI